MSLLLPSIIRPDLKLWLEEVVALCKPDAVHLCTGTEEESQRLSQDMVRRGMLLALNDEKRPGSFLARSSPEDVARVESRTFICTETAEQAGPTNHWKNPAQMKTHLNALFSGCMKGRTCYIIPFCMGPVDSPLAKIGIEITDSAYVVLNMRLMTRMGQSIWDYLESHSQLPFTKAWHSVGVPLLPGDKDKNWPCCPKNLVIAHFPQSQEIWSFGSGYGGNALLGKKCLALRLASWMAKQEGWLAEHMLIMGLTSPEGKKYYIAAAFPSACGKTNLAMLEPSLKGWKVECVGDDIAWMWIDKQGQLRAINPEAGFFGVAPGTSEKTNPVAIKTISKNAIFTNVALTDEGDVWWPGLDKEAVNWPVIDWKSHPCSIEESSKAAHPNSRFTVSATQCPILDPEWNSPEGVPISAIILGGRRSDVAPLVMQSLDWVHGVLMGATLCSEVTAASEGQVGRLRYDPFAMLPFCGYHMGDYFNHWLEMGERLKKTLPIFCVNWFRKSESGEFLWPGFGENVRVLEWIVGVIEGKLQPKVTPVGALPKKEDLNTQDLTLAAGALDQLLEIRVEDWQEEMARMKDYLKLFADHLPLKLEEKLSKISFQLDNTTF